MNLHEHTSDCYEKWPHGGGLKYTPCREDGLDKNLHEMRTIDFESLQRAQDVVRGLTLTCKEDVAMNRTKAIQACVESQKMAHAATSLRNSANAVDLLRSDKRSKAAYDLMRELADEVDREADAAAAGMSSVMGALNSKEKR